MASEDCDEEDYGSCERCGCNLTGPSEAMDGVCDQCLWWISQCSEEQRP